MSEKYKPYIQSVDNFPIEGITFYDISPLLGDGKVFNELVGEIAEPLRGKVDKIVGFNARGFLFAGAIATRLEVGMVMLRKSGKLPGAVYETSYDLEYGSNSLAIQVDALQKDERVLLVDDVIATGGTAVSGIELVQKCGAEVVEFFGVIDLPELGGSRRIMDAGVAVRSVVTLQA